MAQITAALPLLGLPRSQQMTITRSDGTQVLAAGLDDPQAMRMILLQILTGRRASEIRTCDFDCLSPVPGPAAANGEEVARFTYAQSKIDIAPDSILVDREVIAVIEDQQAWVRAIPGHHAGLPVPAAVREHVRRQAVHLQHLQPGAAGLQRHRRHHRRQGAACPARPHPPLRQPG